jgi:long-chain fatty acid transport protein
VRPIQAQGLFLNGGGKADITLPETAFLGGSHKLHDRWTLLGELAWTRWSRFDELRIQFDNPAQPDSVTDESWDDTWRASLGVDYLLDNQWTLRGGLTYDQSPVPGPEHRTPRIPDMDRYWLALGLGFNATETVAVDIGYVHIFVEDGDSRVPGPTGSLMVGEWASHVDIVSAAVTWKL